MSGRVASASSYLPDGILVAPRFRQLGLKLPKSAVCRFLCEYMFLAHLGKYQGIQLLDHVVRTCSALAESAKLPSGAAVPICIAVTHRRDSCHCACPPAVSVLRVLTFDPSSQCIATSPRCFSGRFPNVLWWGDRSLWMCNTPGASARTELSSTMFYPQQSFGELGFERKGRPWPGPWGRLVV